MAGENKRKTSEAQIRAVEKYEKENIKRVVLKLNKKTDADIIAYLETLDSVNAYIKSLLRKDMYD